VYFFWCNSTQKRPEFIVWLIPHTSTRNRELHRQIWPLFWNALRTHSDIVADQSQSANTSAAFFPAISLGLVS
jgi:hypothetical protein